MQGFRGRPARERRPLAATSLRHKHGWSPADDLRPPNRAAKSLLSGPIRGFTLTTIMPGVPEFSRPGAPLAVAGVLLIIVFLERWAKRPGSKY